MTYLYVSGIDNEPKLKACQKRNAKRVLISFEYLSKKKDMRGWLQQYPFEWFIDSGAFTLNQAKPDLSYCKGYLKQYLRFLESCHDVISCAVGMDLDYAIGSELSMKWEKEFLPHEQSGLPIIHVWHPMRGMQQWERMCIEHGWVGISAGHYERNPETIPGMVAQARTKLTRVHGFAITRQSNARNPFYSIDSSSWMMGAQYGQTTVWEGGRLKQIEKSERPRYYAQWSAAGIPRNLIESDHYTAIYEVNLLAYLEWEKYLQLIHKPENLEVKPPPPEFFNKCSSDDLEYWCPVFFGEYEKFDTKKRRRLLRVVSQLLREKVEDIVEEEDQVSLIEIAESQEIEYSGGVDETSVKSLINDFREEMIPKAAMWEYREQSDLPTKVNEAREEGFTLHRRGEAPKLILPRRDVRW